MCLARSPVGSEFGEAPSSLVLGKEPSTSRILRSSQAKTYR